MIANMKARLLQRFKDQRSDGTIIEIVIWALPHSVLGSTHRFKYRLFFGIPGIRLIGYDNERNKGDHRHFDDKETPYRFVSPEQLLDDFANDIAT